MWSRGWSISQFLKKEIKKVEIGVFFTSSIHHCILVLTMDLE
jgi:hypothetical protein